MTRFDVTPERLLEAAKFAQDTADGLIDRHQRVSQQVTALLDTGWTGQAADAYRKGWSEWDQGFRKVVTGLLHEVYIMQNNAASFANLDVNNAANMNDVGRNL
ncbi:WXG100 family type VII secretion target [Mycobacteroides chelonae]|uniref:WXG100 family type VII secretion target n=1 Tax=Mycobacteroides chelonae TaxID=1774 RepID=UPI0018B05517|nr:WXG100 family type VII secretion target [Mycobacteroides chelonae]MBF9349348.1 WXG100 family type VII secretion target [Mycobacteroides chelonae]QQG96294.1 WXG100 family type VII secretion target [Mycobacteroides chelonae]